MRLLVPSSGAAARYVQEVNERLAEMAKTKSTPASTKRPASVTPLHRCEAQHPIKKWPYVKRCTRPVTEPQVLVIPLDEQLDLCTIDYEEYLATLTKPEADEMRAYRAEANRTKS